MSPSRLRRWGEDYARRRASFAEPVLARFASEAYFYLAYLDHIAPLEAAGLSFCLPELSIAAEGRESHSFAQGAFDMVLAAKLHKAGGRVVVNDFELAGEERFVVVTGPNHGGKTTFARAFGQLHHLAALGLPAPAGHARLILADAVHPFRARGGDRVARQRL